MKLWNLAPAGVALTGALALPTVTLSTDYARDRALRVETRTELELETTSSEITVDGEPVEGRGGGGGGSTASTYRVVTKDVVLAHADGEPTKVRRAFETLEGSSATTFGERDFTADFESELEGVTLELVREDGEVVAEVTDGAAPSRDGPLEGHRLTLLADAFLPAGEVEVDQTWDLGEDAILRGLGSSSRARCASRRSSRAPAASARWSWSARRKARSPTPSP